MDILNKVTGQLMAGIEDVKGFFAEVGEDVQHEWQCLTSDGEPVVEPTEDGIVPAEPDATKYPTINPQLDMGVSDVPSVQNPLGQELVGLNLPTIAAPDAGAL